MSVEFRELRWAIVASQHRSLRQAAEALNIRQSTLSRCLRDLECKLGATRFERTNGGTRPTIEDLEMQELPVEDLEAQGRRNQRSRSACRRVGGCLNGRFCRPKAKCHQRRD
ncbi:MAG: LysR family transcriptional regulator [Mesorhizobium sp.]|nr:MAG: LysR family transcriptional regulator [Mesorhizobium sp.]